MPPAKPVSEPVISVKSTMTTENHKNEAIDEHRSAWLLKLVVGLTLIGTALQTQLFTF